MDSIFIELAKNIQSSTKYMCSMADVLLIKPVFVTSPQNVRYNSQSADSSYSHLFSALAEVEEGWTCRRAFFLLKGREVDSWREIESRNRESGWDGHFGESELTDRNRKSRGGLRLMRVGDGVDPSCYFLFLWTEITLTAKLCCSGYLFIAGAIRPWHL